MNYYILLDDSNRVLQVIPEEDPSFPGVPIEKRYPASLLEDAIVCPEPVSAEPGMLYDPNSKEFYWPPVQEPEPVPESIEEHKAAKIAELSAACNRAIVGGADVLLSDGSTAHFDYDANDQANVLEMFNAVVLGAVRYPYQASGGSCTIYRAADIVAIYTTLAGNKTGVLTYYHQLKDYVTALDEAQTVVATQWGQPLTGDYLAHYTEAISVAQEQMAKILARLGAGA